jgi:Molecular chaperone GrpE (heat shock protein)
MTNTDKENKEQIKKEAVEKDTITSEQPSVQTDKTSFTDQKDEGQTKQGEGDIKQPEEGDIDISEPVSAEPGSSEIEGLKSEIDRLTKEVAAYKDKWLRAEAELDNYKKRVHKERLEQLKYGYETLIRELLPVIDNLERAIEYSKKHSQKDSLYEGVELTLKLLKKVIEGFGVSEINSIGQVFDPNLHEGVGIEEGEDYEDNVVIKEVEKGYLYKDRLIRPAKVIVGKKSLPININEQT